MNSCSEESYRKQDGDGDHVPHLLKPLVLSDNVPRVLGISANITER